MAEIYRNAVNKAIVFPIDGGEPISAKFVKSSGKISLSSQIEDGVALIPHSITQFDGEFSVEWKYMVDNVSYTFTEYHKVVTPLFSAQELKSFNEQFESLSDDKIVQLEKLVRGVIESYTGQSFGIEDAIISIGGTGNAVLSSPKRIIRIDSLYDQSLAETYQSYRTIKSGFGVETYLPRYEQQISSSVGRIRTPFSGWTYVFERGNQYTLSGLFGWTSVPEEINQAALLIAEMFSCREASWRDRYLRAVTAADWRFDFHDKAFSGTGSATADALLEPFIVSSMAVI